MTSLTGQPLPVALVIAATGLFALVVAGWPRLTRRSVTLVVRGAQVLALNLVVVLVAGVLLNDQYDFYVSWSDLFGGSSVSTTASRGMSARAAAESTPPGVGLTTLRMPAVLPPLPQPGARIQTYSLTGAVSGVRGTVLVVLPAGYDPTSHRQYPVIEAFHGYPGVPLSGERALQLPGSLDAVVRSHTVAPAIVVLPQTDNPNRLDTECMNDPSGRGPQVETWLSRDIPDWVVRHFRVSRARTSWATMGYSLGGWCSAMIGMRHPDIFGASVVLMGYFRPEFAPSYDPAAPSSPAALSHDLIAMAHSTPPPLAMWIMAAKDDHRAYKPTMDFLKAAKAPLSVTADILRSGGHRVSIVPSLIPKVMTWLASSLRGFRP
jgi:S-formylglutathione hydrolase FrmB